MLAGVQPSLGPFLPLKIELQPESCPSRLRLWMSAVVLLSLFLVPHNMCGSPTTVTF